MDFSSFLQAIGAATRLDISAAAQDGGCTLVFSDTLEVTFEHDEGHQKVVLFAPIVAVGQWPAETRARMLARVLETHLFGLATDDSYFGFDPQLERIIFFRSIALARLEPAQGLQAVESFVNQLEHRLAQLLQSDSDSAAALPAASAAAGELPIQRV